VFERFTRHARVAVVLAQEEARETGSDHIGAEHLLHGVVSDREGVTALVLQRWGVDASRVSAASRAARDLDEQALSALGIDLDAVRRRAEEAFGPGALDRPVSRSRWGRRAAKGHIPFTDEAKNALEQALRAAVRAHDTEITSGHLFLGLLAVEPGTALRVLRRAGVPASADELARLVRERLDEAA
jgi:ATP-dependent Clp protease ATP-binding subunit ClpA